MSNEKAAPEIPEQLRDDYAMTANPDEAWGPAFVRELIECVAALTAEVAALKADIARLSAPVSHEEWNGIWHTSARDFADKLILARATPPQSGGKA